LAEDLAQETFARALKAGTPFRDPNWRSRPTRC